MLERGALTVPLLLVYTELLFEGGGRITSLGSFLLMIPENDSRKWVLFTAEQSNGETHVTDQTLFSVMAVQA